MKCKYVILTLLFFINISTADQGSTELRRGPGYYITEDGNLYRLGCLPEIEMPTWIIPSPGIPLKTKYRSSIDLSENLPPIRSQGGQGSCVAWATGYYYKTYQEWQEHNWDVTTEDHQFSPAFIYNHINGGQDAGSYVSDAFKALLDLGCATWFDMPYTDENYTNLPDEETYFNAINYRCEDVFYINMFEDLESVKNHLLDSNLVVFCINIYEHFYDIGDHNYTYCVNTFYGDYVGGHCVTICGFDDDRPTEDGPGAFKIVNSWGPDWGDNGYFWMSYEAVQNPTLSQMWALYSMDKIDYNPTLISRHYVDHDIRGRVAFQFGIGEGSDPLWKKHLFDWFQRSSLPLPFPPTNVVVDLTDGIDHLSEIEPNNIYIRCKDERFFWHTSYEHAYEGKSWWCADEEIPGYDNGWLMFYETPNVTLGSTDNLFTFMLSYAIEEPGDYGNYDGWDAANVRISTDGFETWEVLNGFPDYDFTSGWGWGYNGEGENIPGWGGYHPEWQPATFDLSAYANETIQIRIAFGSDGAWCSRDDPTYFGIVVDDITIIGGGDIIFYDDAESRDLPGTIDYFATEHLDWNVLEISDETPITIPEGYEYAFANVSIQPEEPYDGPIWYVSTTGCDSTGDGSEENPFATIQFGIDTATENDTVLVAAGTYYENIIWPATNGIKLIGNGEEDCVIDGDSVASVIRFEENLGGIIDSTTVISNISIQNGFAHNEWETESGGGIFLYSSSPAIVNVLIKENFGDNGGGIACIHWSNPLISYVTIQDNLASYSGGGILIDGHSSPTVESSNVINNACYLYNYSSGGGIAINDSSNAQIKNVVLKNNEADYGGGLTISWESDAMLYGLQINNNFGRTSGGGMEIHFSNPIVQNCEIKYNSTEYYGGGIYVHSLGSSYKISPLFEGVVVHHNSSMHGGGLYSEHGPRCILRNSTLVNNTAEAGSGVYIRHSSYPRFINSIIWGNHDIPQVTSFGVGGPCSLLVAFTDVQGGEAMGIQDNGNCEVYWEEGNIFYYPDFIDSLNGDYNLLSDSPCIDAGTDFFVWEGDTLVDMTEDEYYGSAPDMGAFEYYGETLVQYINLSTGWNIFSTYFIPEDLEMLSVVGPLIDAGTLDKVIDEAGNTILYFMGNWVNNIGDLANTEGYYIKVNDDVALTIEGTAVELPFEIDLAAGWNIMGYPTETAQDALTVVQPLIDANELEKVLDDTGNAIIYFFGEWVNNIGDFEAGEGYYTKVNTNTSLTISEPVLARIKTATVEDKTEKTSLSHFSPVFTGNPFMPMGVYLVGEEFANLDLETGDEVAVYDNDLCVGANVVEGEISIANPLIIITSMDDEIGMPGFSEGNPISYRVWDASENSELVVNDITNYDVTTGNELNSKPVFDGLGIIAVGFKSYLGGIDETTIPESFALHQNYPNPFNPVTTIRYHLPVKSDLRLKIYDLKGRLVETLVNKQQNPGFYSVEWKAENVSSGVYFYRLEATEFTETKKMVLLR